MPNKKGTGLLMVWCDVPEEVEDEFNRWYNEEHVAERMAIPGFLNAARYEAVQNGPKHLAVYELESPEVLYTPEYKQISENPTEWTKRMGPTSVGTVFIRNVYRLIFPDRVTEDAAQSDMAPALQIGRMDIPSEIEDEWHEWYNSVYIPNYEKVPGVIRGRRYTAVEGQPQYLTMYEFENETVSKSDEWFTQQNANPRNEGMRQAMNHVPGSPGIWKKTFQL